MKLTHVLKKTATKLKSYRFTNRIKQESIPSERYFAIYIVIFYIEVKKSVFNDTTHIYSSIFNVPMLLVIFFHVKNFLHDMTYMLVIRLLNKLVQVLFV